ncbi:MAG: DNA polymerase III subunit delta' [Gammaproteobacteria bacterium]|nr:DNA polymerase III subunit delta' [Gammaproteobacteria bacterium]MBU1414782.1 DNA polymerase III subunit delta' [Gammaproteobacteria bacterium]
MPHALLLTGSEGIGKGRFALAMAARLLCEAPLSSGDACGECPSCRWFASGNHPDFRHVIPEADVDSEGAFPEGERKKSGSQQILINQIRALEDFVFVGGHRSGARVLVVEPADAMNQPAQNAILKILEEPPSSVYFILISTHWRRLLPTIRSRCRKLPLPRPSSSEAQAWLRTRDETAIKLLPLLGNAPLLAHAASESGRGSVYLGVLASLADPGRDPLALAARWQTQLQPKSEGGLPVQAFVETVQKWVFNLALFKLAGRTRLGSETDALCRLAGHASAGGLLRCYNELMKARSLASHPLNPQLFFEDIAERYLRALASERT